MLFSKVLQTTEWYQLVTPTETKSYLSDGIPTNDTETWDFPAIAKERKPEPIIMFREQ